MCRLSAPLSVTCGTKWFSHDDAGDYVAGSATGAGLPVTLFES